MTGTEPTRYYYITIVGTFTKDDDGSIADDTADKFASDFGALAKLHGLRFHGSVRGETRDTRSLRLTKELTTDA